jgi:hypothetical protein
MTQSIAGIARNSCPLCGELTGVPTVRLVLNYGVDAFRCSACKGRISVASSTRGASLLGGLLGIGVAIWIFFQFSAWLDRTGPRPHPTWYGFLLVLLLMVLGFGAYFACAIPCGRWTLKLEPAFGLNSQDPRRRELP